MTTSSLTPPRPLTLPTWHNTPVVQRESSGSKYRSGDLGEGRDAVLRDVGVQAPVVDVPGFLTLLPASPVSVSAVDHVLESRGYNGGWISHYFYDSPSKLATGKLEDAVFEPFIDLWTDVISAAQESFHQPSTLELVQKPNQTSKSIRPNSSRDDAHMLLKQKFAGTNGDRQDDWEDTAATWEFKVNDSRKNRNDNNMKVIWTLHHILRNDPCRRFSFSVTVEDHFMTLWFACRSGLIISERFNFLAEPLILIDLFLRLAYAQPVDLGWDPTMKCISRGEHPRYEIEVYSAKDSPPRTFVTTDVLSNIRADTIRGQATRVYLAYEKADPAHTMRVLKDVWVDDDREREGEIIAELYKEISDPTELRQVHKHFFTVMTHGDVLINGAADKIRQVCRALPLGSLTYRNIFSEKAGPSPNTSSYSRGIEAAFHTYDTRSIYSFSLKTHYRIVFEEVGTPLYAVQSLRTVMQVVSDASNGLAILHAHGWVHRDLSAGNLYHCASDSHGKIGDLEYTKRVLATTSHEVRIGTLAYMAIEVYNDAYMFVPLATTSSEEFDKMLQSIMDSKPSERQGDARSPHFSKLPSAIPFRYHPLHDLESLFWIVLWVFLNFKEEGYNYTEEHKQRYLASNKTLFSYVEGGNERLFFFRSPSGSQDHNFLSAGFFKPYKMLRAWGATLLTEYLRYEQTYNQDAALKATASIHASLQKICTLIKQLASTDVQIVLAPDFSSPETVSRKRQGTADEGAPQSSRRRMRTV